MTPLSKLVYVIDNKYVVLVFIPYKHAASTGAKL